MVALKLIPSHILTGKIIIHHPEMKTRIWVVQDCAWLDQVKYAILGGPEEK